MANASVTADLIAPSTAPGDRPDVDDVDALRVDPGEGVAGGQLRDVTHTPVCRRGQRGCWRAQRCVAGSHRFRPRPPVSKERSRLRVLYAVPSGAVPARRMTVFMGQVEERLVGRDPRWRRSVLAVARQLGYGTEWRSSVATPLWPELAAASDVSVRTVARVLRWLRDERLLGVVASGQSARYSGSGNLAAVYVVCVPRSAVDTSGTPTVLPLVVDPQRTRANAAHDQAEPLRGRPSGAPDPVDGPAPPAAGGPGPRRAARIRSRAVAIAVRSRVAALSLVSIAAVATVVRPFVQAGWSAADVCEAIDWQPSRRRHPHSSLTHGIDPRYADRVVARRLAAWLVEGQPTASPSARRAATLHQERAQLRAQLDARTATRTATTMPAGLRALVDALPHRHRRPSATTSRDVAPVPGGGAS